MRKHPEENGILSGGQGRSAEDIEDAYSALAFCGAILLAAICIFILAGCARPSARVEPSIDATPDERAANDTPDRPHWEELRQQLGGL